MSVKLYTPEEIWDSWQAAREFGVAHDPGTEVRIFVDAKDFDRAIGLLRELLDDDPVRYTSTGKEARAFLAEVGS